MNSAAGLLVKGCSFIVYQLKTIGIIYSDELCFKERSRTVLLIVIIFLSSLPS